MMVGPDGPWVLHKWVQRERFEQRTGKTLWHAPGRLNARVRALILSNANRPPTPQPALIQDHDLGSPVLFQKRSEYTESDPACDCVVSGEDWLIEKYGHHPECRSLWPICQVADPEDPRIECKYADSGGVRCEVRGLHKDHYIGSHTMEHSLAGNGYTCDSFATWVPNQPKQGTQDA